MTKAKPKAKLGRPVKNEIKQLNASALNITKAILKVESRKRKFKK